MSQKAKALTSRREAPKSLALNLVNDRLMLVPRYAETKLTFFEFLSTRLLEISDQMLVAAAAAETVPHGRRPMHQQFDADDVLHRFRPSEHKAD
jgi:hypothetical protein